ncbi:MAG: asmA family protein [Novosphingobium sp.]|nr:asmA family protein [Novosphingobium sp.]
MNFSKRTKIAIACCAAALAALAMVAAAFPASWFKSLAENRLSAEIGRPVTIATMERESAFSFNPVVRVTGISIPQAAWAGPGKLGTIAALRVRVAVLPALIGKADIQLLSADGVTLNLVRDAAKRVNWRDAAAPKEQSSGDGVSLDDIGSVKAVVTYRDAFQHRAFRMNVTIDQAHGLVATGHGEIEGNAVTVTAKGPAGKAGSTWPFAAHIAGTAIDMTAEGTMAGPLQTHDMQFRVTARANDLKLIDRIVEAGLFGTQPVNLTANVRREPTRWTIADLAGKIGSSDLVAKLIVDKIDGRTKLSGDVRFTQLDFADLSTDAGLAAGFALERAEGKKLVPNTRINIRKMVKTDGRIAFRIDRIVSRGGPSTLRSAQGVLTLDHRLLVAKPFNLTLSQGTLNGEVRVDQRNGQSKPTVTLALDLRNSSIDTLAGGAGAIDAPVDGRIRLVGVGSTIREAVGAADGTIGLIAHDGSLPAKLANLLGFDVGKILFAGDDKRATLRCAVARLEVSHGIGSASPVLVDTSESQTRGVGAISFPDERIALTLTGAPKRNSVLRLPGSALARGTIRDPSVAIPKEVKSFGNILKAVGRAITGKQGLEAVDANCAGLRARVIGN